MLIRKGLILALATAVGIALSPLPMATAAPTLGVGQHVAGDNLVQIVKGKKKAKKAKKAKKKGKRKKAGKSGSCGTYMYRKGGKCLDARNKK